MEYYRRPGFTEKAYIGDRTVGICQNYSHTVTFYKSCKLNLWVKTEAERQACSREFWDKWD